MVWLPISKWAASQFWLPISASTVAQFLLSIFKSAVRLQNLIEISVGLAYPMGELE